MRTRFFIRLCAGKQAVVLPSRRMDSFTMPRLEDWADCHMIIHERSCERWVKKNQLTRRLCTAGPRRNDLTMFLGSMWSFNRTTETAFNPIPSCSGASRESSRIKREHPSEPLSIPPAHLSFAGLLVPSTIFHSHLLITRRTDPPWSRLLGSPLNIITSAATHNIFLLSCKHYHVSTTCVG